MNFWSNYYAPRVGLVESDPLPRRGIPIILPAQAPPPSPSDVGAPLPVVTPGQTTFIQSLGNGIAGRPGLTPSQGAQLRDLFLMHWNNKTQLAWLANDLGYRQRLALAGGNAGLIPPFNGVLAELAARVNQLPSIPGERYD